MPDLFRCERCNGLRASGIEHVCRFQSATEDDLLRAQREQAQLEGLMTDEINDNVRVGYLDAHYEAYKGYATSEPLPLWCSRTEFFDSVADDLAALPVVAQ